jgi:hypothetical protein
MARFGRVPGLLDASSQVLYDTLSLVAGTAVYRFFSVPIGGAKSRLKTNMVLAGVLPSPQSFLVKAVRVIAKGSATTAKVDSLVNASYIIFKVGEKEALVAPTVLFNAGCGVVNNITTDVAQNGVQDARSMWTLDKPVMIGINQSFSIELTYDTAPVTATAGIEVLIVLDGDQTRGVQ